MFYKKYLIVSIFLAILCQFVCIVMTFRIDRQNVQPSINNVTETIQNVLQAFQLLRNQIAPHQNQANGSQNLVNIIIINIKLSIDNGESLDFLIRGSKLWEIRLLTENFHNNLKKNN
uniref:Secreted protein n=1 Tax=Meloidogyne hapla TaxID=6305 RepID=A0A1I8BVL8_MELHA